MILFHACLRRATRLRTRGCAQVRWDAISLGPCGQPRNNFVRAALTAPLFLCCVHLLIGNIYLHVCDETCFNFGARQAFLGITQPGSMRSDSFTGPSPGGRFCRVFKLAAKQKFDGSPLPGIPSITLFSTFSILLTSPPLHSPHPSSLVSFSSHGNSYEHYVPDICRPCDCWHF